MYWYLENTEYSSLLFNKQVIVMVYITILPNLLRKYVLKQCFHASSISTKNTSKHQKIVVEKRVEEVDDLLDPGDSVLLSSLCAPGTESFTIKQFFVNKKPHFKELECNDSSLYNSLELASKMNKDVRLFTRKISTVHVTYVEPNK